MEERNNEITIIRGSNPEELVVYHASSLEDEIRFYINETQYISAIEKSEEDISVELREEAKEERNKSKIKLAKKDYLNICKEDLTYKERFDTLANRSYISG